MKVSIDKKYKTKTGKPVRIVCTDRVSSKGKPVLALINDGIEEFTSFYTAGGFANTDMAFSELDLVEVTPWDDFKIDDSVMANLTGGKPFKAHFAGVVDGWPTVYPNGCTSWTGVGKDRTFVDKVFKPTDRVEIDPIIPTVPTWSNLNPPFNHYHQPLPSTS